MLENNLKTLYDESETMHESGTMQLNNVDKLVLNKNMKIIEIHIETETQTKTTKPATKLKSKQKQWTRQRSANNVQDGRHMYRDALLIL